MNRCLLGTMFCGLACSSSPLTEPPYEDANASDGGIAQSDGAPSCAPVVPHPTWTSPYAGVSRGLPTAPTFFPIAVWLQQPSHATEFSKLGVNVMLGNNGSTDPMSANDLATLKSLGMYAIIGQDSLGLSLIDDPTVAGWWLADEPDNAQPNGHGGYGPAIAPSAIVTQYQAFKKADPTRPVYLGLGQGVAYDAYEGRGSNPPPEADYVPGSDIVGFDIYPYNNCGGDTNAKVTCGEFWLSAFGVDRLRSWSTHGQAVWADFETTVIAAGSTAGPTPAETVSEVWLALIHGANGIIYFTDSWTPSFREDAIFESPAMVSAITALDGRIASLAPLLNSANVTNLVSVATVDAGASVDFMVKASGSTLTIFAAASRNGTATATFTVAGLSGTVAAVAQGENRTLPIASGRFTDTFAENAVHIYQVDLSTTRCE